jgi:hypothetical protein
VGLPRAADNQNTWDLMRPVLANADIKPTATEIAWMRDAFRDLLKIRAGTTLLRLRTAADIQQRLVFHNLGSNQLPTVIAATVDGAGYTGANHRKLTYVMNVGTTAQTLTVPAAAGQAYVLHPVQAAATAADRRVATEARFDNATGAFTVPARSVAVFVVN